MSEDESGINCSFTDDSFLFMLTNANRGFEINKSNKLKVRTPVYCPYSLIASHPCHNDTLLSRNRFEPLRSLHPNSKHIDDVKLNIKEPISKQIKDKPRETSPLIVMQPIPPSHTLDGIIAQHAIDENPYWLKLHQAMSIPHSDLPFPNIKIGAFNPNGVYQLLGLTTIILLIHLINLK